ncbi:acetyltransferase [Salinicola rhizosphaerae]|uniref:Acetyltransferase n=1 Tax=Salinicola rhizosphaerae TaxID=1443141 RepID=A0ABQ3DN56_9GAMM|nr:acetyltransferase [Salinicola rhizosphaerae]
MIDLGGTLWKQARELRYQLFFADHGLPESVMDDEREASAWHLAAVRDGDLLGYGRLNQLPDGSWLISQMVVAPACQGQGVGRLILRELIDATVRAGGGVIRLNARCHATAFYRNEGFLPVGEPFVSAITGVEHVEMARGS